MPTPPATPTTARLRREFPALAGDLIFLENAGGSQVPACVGDAIRSYMRESYAQLGAGHPMSRRATATVEEAHAFARTLLNARRGHAMIGSSSTVLLNMLARCYGEILAPGSEIILAETGHEANLGPWKRLEKLGATIRWWRLDPDLIVCPLDALDQLLNDNTALVALPHVSNLLGGIVDLPVIVRKAHDAGARVVADGVAYAPHRVVDVDAWGVDWYVYSTYKVYGPHMAVLYGRDDALAELPGPNHFFVPRDDLPYQFEPGGPSHEGCAGLLALGDYLKLLAGADPDAPCDRAVVVRAFTAMEELERPLIERLLAYLNAKPGVRIVGPADPGPARVGTVSFVHESRSSREIAAALDRTEIAARHGNMYAWHLCEALGLDPDDGVLRVSFVHYNTVEEVERLIAVLEEIL